MSIHNRLERLYAASEDDLMRFRRLCGFLPYNCDPDDAHRMVKELINNELGVRLVHAIEYADARWEESSNRLRQAYDAVIEATVEDSGCEDGKRDFLENVGIPEEAWPTANVVVSYQVNVEVPYLSNGDPTYDSEFCEKANETALEYLADVEPDVEWLV